MERSRRRISSWSKWRVPVFPRCRAKAAAQAEWILLTHVSNSAWQGALKMEEGGKNEKRYFNRKRDEMILYIHQALIHNKEKGQDHHPSCGHFPREMKHRHETSLEECYLYGRYGSLDLYGRSARFSIPPFYIRPSSFKPGNKGDGLDRGDPSSLSDGRFIGDLITNPLTRT